MQTQAKARNDFKIIANRVFRKAKDLHWLELEKDPEGNEIPCTSIFFMGRKCKEWGFVDWIQFQGYRWIHNEKYLRENK